MANLFTCPQTGRIRDLDAENREYNAQWEKIHQAAHYSREHDIARTMARYELESDEFYTAREKAINILSRP